MQPDAGDLARPDLLKPNCRVRLICGPPASGKSTYVSARARNDDIVIDLDLIARELGFGRDRSGAAVSEILKLRNMRLAALCDEPRSRTAWVIITAPSRALRSWWCKVLDVKPADLILLVPHRGELRRRIMADADRVHVAQRHLALVDQWFTRERANDPGIGKHGIDDDGCPTDPLHAWNRREPENPRLYNKRRWRRRSRQQLREHPLCEMCMRAGEIRPASVSDHIVPHRGDEALFWNGALQSLCITCHNTQKQREEADGYARAVDDNGWPIDPAHPANRQA